eukprot:gene6871-9408_t
MNDFFLKPLNPMQMLSLILIAIAVAVIISLGSLGYIKASYETTSTKHIANTADSKLMEREDDDDIEHIEIRGITLNQLYEILFEVKRKCIDGNWKREEDGKSKITLCVENVNLADVKDIVDKHIQNYSEANNVDKQTCTYVQTLSVDNKTRKQPDWMVSFWSGKKPKQKLDIYTAYSGADFIGNFNAVGITEGFAKVDKRDKRDRKASDRKSYATKIINSKSWREGYFPLDRIENAAKFDVWKAQAAQEVVRNGILNAIAGVKKASNELQFKDPEKYEYFNRLVKGKFIASAFMSLFQKYGNKLDKYYYSILKQSSVPSLNFLNFSGMNNFNDEVAAQLVDHLPQSITTLQFSLRNCGIGAKGTKILYKIPKLFPYLEKLEIIDAFYGNEAIDVLVESLRYRSTNFKMMTELILTSNNLKSKNLLDLFTMHVLPVQTLSLKHNFIEFQHIESMQKGADRLGVNLITDYDDDGATSSKSVVVEELSSYKNIKVFFPLEPEQSGITINQLKMVMNEIIELCKDGIECFNGVVKRDPKDVNLHDIKEKILKDFTCDVQHPHNVNIKNCSFVERIVKGPQEKEKNKEKFLYDMYAAKTGVNSRTGRSFRAIGITDGLAAIDEGHVYNKVERESYFPLEMIKEVSTFHILDAEASIASDRPYILNAITGYRPKENGLFKTKHVMYERLNEALRGRIVSSSWIQLFKSNCYKNDLRDDYISYYFHSLLRKSWSDTKVSNYQPTNNKININDYYEKLHKSRVDHLHHLDFSKLSSFDNDAAIKLVDSLPNTVRSIGFNLHGCGIGDEGTAKLYSLPVILLQLEKLTILNAEHGGDVISWLTESLSSNLNNNLAMLNISSNNINADEGHLLVEALKVNRSLTELDLWGNHIGQTVIGELAKVLEYRKTFNEEVENKDNTFKDLIVKNIDLILDPVKCGISLAQLKDVLLKIKREYKSWTYTKTEKSLKTITVDDIVDHYIRPRTERRKCSYVETIASAAQAPKWSVIISLRLPFKSLIDCIEQHAVDRGLPSDTYYWIEPFARNCWDKGSVHYSSKLKDNLFQKTLDASDGVVDIIDPRCFSFDRVWCCYDRYKALENNEKLFDIYTPLSTVDPEVDIAHDSQVYASGSDSRSVAATNVETYKNLEDYNTTDTFDNSDICNNIGTSLDSVSGNRNVNNLMSTSSNQNSMSICEPILANNMGTNNASFSLSNIEDYSSPPYNKFAVSPASAISHESNESYTYSDTIGKLSTSNTIESGLKAVGLLSAFGTIDNNDPESKYEREIKFPLSILKKMLQFDITSGSTSNEKDKNRALNELIDRDVAEMDEDFDLNHSKYVKINNKVRGSILVLGWTLLFDKTTISINEHDVTYFRMLKESNITHIRFLNLSKISIFKDPAKVKSLVDSLPISLIELKIRLSKSTSNDYSNQNQAIIACSDLLFNLPNRLPDLKVFSIENTAYGDECIHGLLAQINKPDCKITSLRLHDCNLTIKSANAFKNVLPTNKTLNELILSSNRFGKEGKIKIIDGIIENEIKTLKKLNISDDSYDHTADKELLDKLQKCDFKHLSLADNVTLKTKMTELIRQNSINEDYEV